MSCGTVTVNVCWQSFTPPSNLASTAIEYVRPLPPPSRSARSRMSCDCEPGPIIVGLVLAGGAASRSVWPEPGSSSPSFEVVIVEKNAPPRRNVTLLFCDVSVPTTHPRGCRLYRRAAARRRAHTGESERKGECHQPDASAPLEPRRPCGGLGVRAQWREAVGRGL